MSDENEKNLFIVDHANKSGDRERRNPNRVAGRRVADKWREYLAGLAAGQSLQSKLVCSKRSKPKKSESCDNS